TVSDPFKYARNIAFHSKLGLFNPVQLLNQAQTMIHSVAIAGPVNGFKGMTAGTLMTMLRMTENPKVIEHFAGMAENLGIMRRADFLESYAAMKRTGWDLVQGETAWRNDVMDPQLVRSTMGKVLDAGTVFFQNGERLSRLTGWNTAFIEFKKANPGVKIDDRAL